MNNLQRTEYLDDTQSTSIICKHICIRYSFQPSTRSFSLPGCWILYSSIAENRDSEKPTAKVWFSFNIFSAHHFFCYLICHLWCLNLSCRLCWTQKNKHHCSKSVLQSSMLPCSLDWFCVSVARCHLLPLAWRTNVNRCEETCGLQ